MQEVFDKQDIVNLGELAQRRGVRLVVLFGSRATGTAHEASDIDIGIAFKEGEYSPAAELAFTGELMGLLKTGRLDVIVLDRAEPLLLKQVATAGIPLYEEEPGLFNRYQLSYIKKYFDSAKFRRLADNNMEDFLKAKGA